MSNPSFRPQDVEWAKRQDVKRLQLEYEEHKKTEEGHRYWRQLVEAELAKRGTP